jgi:hypothetical protein
MFARRFLVLGSMLLVLTTGYIAADSPTVADADKLVEKLGSTKFAERESAIKSLEALGPAALPALRRGVDAKDPEVRQRVVDLITKHERQADCDIAFIPTKVRLKVTEQPLADVVADLAKQVNIRMQLAREPADLPGRRITLDLGEKPFWEALDTLCREAKISIRPTSFEPLTTDDAGAILARGMMNLMRTEEPLVLQDGVLSPCPTAYIGAARVRLIPDRWGNRNRGPAEEHKWTIEVLSEPRLNWQAAPTVQFDPVTGLTVTTSSKDDSAPKGVAGLPGAGGGIVFAGAPAFRVGGVEGPGMPRAATRHEIPIYLKADAAGATAFPELKGALTGGVKLAPEALVAIADVQKADSASAKAKDGAKLTVRDCKIADDGTVTLKVELERPAAGGGLGNAGFVQRVQIGGAGGALPANVARAIGAMHGDGESFRLLDKRGGQYTVSIGETASNTNNGVTVITYTLECQPPEKDAKPKKLELHGPRRASVDGRFTLRDVPMP